jgi:hypothetical protein
MLLPNRFQFAGSLHLSWNLLYVCVRVRACVNDHMRVRGTRWRSWLRHCATSRMVAGSIPDGVIGILH